MSNNKLSNKWKIGVFQINHNWGNCNSYDYDGK